MKYYDWNAEKNESLVGTREVSFEDIVVAITEGNVLDIYDHPDTVHYPNQQILVIAISDYAYLVPCVEDDEKVFLKTIIPSRKATKKYLIKK